MMPVGTVIVKEKLANVKDKNPVMCTVMRKREAGYDSAHGDWEYSVIDEKGKVTGQDVLDRCISCHEEQKSSDYVFRSYIKFN